MYAHIRAIQVKENLGNMTCHRNILDLQKILLTYFSTLFLGESYQRHCTPGFTTVVGRLRTAILPHSGSILDSQLG